MKDVDVRFADRDGKRIAFEVFGSGPCDVVVVQHVCPIDLLWDLPQLASFMETLGAFARVIAFDSRGAGASDPIPDYGSASLEAASDDLLTVLDAAGSPRAVILDLSLGISGVMFAATYPERVQSLIVLHLQLSFPELRNLSAEQREHLAQTMSTGERFRDENPRVAHDRGLQQWWGRAQRLLYSPDAAKGRADWAARIDAEAALASVRVPALVLHRENSWYDIERSRAAANRIAGARFVAIPGSEGEFFLGDATRILDEIEQFLREEQSVPVDDRPLATVLFADIVASTEQLAAMGDQAWRRFLDEHDDAVAREVATHRGRVVKTMGDGVLVTFDGPARAVSCAAAIRDAAADRGVVVCSGLHTGEIELRNGDVAGIAVHIASRVAALAGPGEILVSRTVVDLTAGAGIEFESRGDHQLKGVPGVWALSAAVIPVEARRP